jgi:8-oxo-dGTP diphosphatase
MNRPPDEAPIRVGIGLVGREGRYLVRQRPSIPGSPMPGYWEFPGGKCENDETPEQATLRECTEEIGTTVVVGPRRRVVRHRYPHGFVELHYFDCHLADPTAQPAPGSGFRWVACSELLQLRFPDANEPVVRDLACEASSPQNA